LLERVYYQSQQFQITRKDKPMARLIGEPFMQAIDELIESDPALADTLALMLNKEALETINQGREEYQKGEAIPIEEALK
jgi:hypothetical protein